MKESHKTPRRTFLKASTLATLALAGCKNKTKKFPFIEPTHTVFLKNEEPPTEDISQYIDNTLGNGFSFHFTDLEPNGIEFNNIKKIGDSYQATDAIGYSFNTEFSGKNTTFTITNLTWNEKGTSITLTDGTNTFTSAQDISDDTTFSGLEHTLNPANSKTVNASYYNGTVQEDAYFRIDAVNSDSNILLRKTEKIRTPDAKIPEFSIHTKMRYATSHDIEIKNIRRQKPFTSTNTPEVDGLEKDFIFDFSSQPLEARLEETPGFGLSFPQEFFNQTFLENGKEYIIRYIGVDTRKIPSNREWNVFYPINLLFTEILEDPLEITIEKNVPININLNGEGYEITLTGFKETKRNL